MHKFFKYLAICVLTSCTVAQAQMPSHNQLKQKLNNQLQNFCKDRNPSGVILIAQNDEVLVSRSLSFADRNAGQKNTTQTQFLIGSITKQFSAAAVLHALYARQLAQGVDQRNEELILAAVQKELHQPLAVLFPKDHPIWQGVMPVWAAEISIHHLLIHSTGLPNFNSSREFRAKAHDKVDMQQLMNYVKTYKLDFKPGEKYAYNNTNYILLSLLIYPLSGKPLSQYLEQNFFIPLSMHATFLGTGTVLQLKKNPHYQRLARGYEFTITEPNPTLAEITDYEFLDIASGAGGMVSTVEDLHKWNQALYGGKVLPKAIFKLMTSRHIKCEKSAFDYYGYGIAHQENPSLGEIYIHAGKIAGFASHLIYVPSLDITVVSMSNLVPGGAKLRHALLDVKNKAPLGLSKPKFEEHVRRKMTEIFPAYSANEERYDLRLYVDALLDNWPAA